MSAERIVWMGGSQPRHLAYVNKLAEELNVVGGVMQDRSTMIPSVPQGLSAINSQLWARHFSARAITEKRFFPDAKVPDIELMEVTKDTLNTPEVADFVNGFNPDLVLVFGTGMIREPLFSALPDATINLHLGLSPRYRGAATLFWPFYNLEPQWAGTTFHYIVDTPDGGDIIHQVTPVLEEDDRIHEVACKAMQQSFVEAVGLVKMFPEWEIYPQKPESGKNYLEGDFKPQMLQMIYQNFDDNLVKAYLNGIIGGSSPKLKRQDI